VELIFVKGPNELGGQDAVLAAPDGISIMMIIIIMHKKDPRVAERKSVTVMITVMSRSMNLQLLLL
jgi:hypothetical protein